MSDPKKEYIENGYVKISRKVFSSRTFSTLNAIQKLITIYLILMANHKDNDWWDGYQKKFITVKRGSFITSIEHIRKKINDRLVTTKKIRTCVKLLKKMQFLAIERASRYSLITIIKYDLYQSEKSYRARQRARQGQDKGKIRAINNNGNNVKNKEKGIVSTKAWKEYKIMRSKIRKPMTEKAEELIINKLNKLTPDVKKRVAILNQSIMNSWQGVFPLKETTIDEEYNCPEYKPKKMTKEEIEKGIKTGKKEISKVLKKMRNGK